MTAAPSPHPDRRRLLAVLAYYPLVAGAVVLLMRMVPIIGETLAGSGLTQMTGANIFGDASGTVGTPVASTPWSGGLLGVISMVGALGIMVPVTWIYMVTRSARGYHESVVHTLLILPVAVTGIVMIVQHSLALAFSLAGIVAAVRFRTTLEDTKDAVYVFLAIGVGLACGVQAMGLALVLSLVFNVVVLVLWATRFGDPDAATSRSGALALGAGVQRHLAADRLKKKAQRANTLLRLPATEVAAAQAALEPILEEATLKWKLAEVAPAPQGGWVLDYLVRLDPPGAAGPLLDRIHKQGQGLEGVELRSLKGLKGKA